MQAFVHHEDGLCSRSSIILTIFGDIAGLKKKKEMARSIKPSSSVEYTAIQQRLGFCVHMFDFLSLFLGIYQTDAVNARSAPPLY